MRASLFSLLCVAAVAKAAPDPWDLNDALPPLSCPVSTCTIPSPKPPTRGRIDELIYTN